MYKPLSGFSVKGEVEQIGYDIKRNLELRKYADNPDTEKFCPHCKSPRIIHGEKKWKCMDCFKSFKSPIYNINKDLLKDIKNVPTVPDSVPAPEIIENINKRAAEIAGGIIIGNSQIVKLMMAIAENPELVLSNAPVSVSKTVEEKDIDIKAPEIVSNIEVKMEVKKKHQIKF